MEDDIEAVIVLMSRAQNPGHDFGPGVAVMIDDLLRRAGVPANADAVAVGRKVATYMRRYPNWRERLQARVDEAMTAFRAAPQESLDRGRAFLNGR
ncbi:MAG: hypothetical protein ACAI38_06215 [Myxococcota bacterium]